MRRAVLHVVIGATLFTTSFARAECLTDAAELARRDDDFYFVSTIMNDFADAPVRPARVVERTVSEFGVDSHTAAALVALASCWEVWTARPGGLEAGDVAAVRGWLTDVIRGGEHVEDVRWEVRALLSLDRSEEMGLERDIAETLLATDPSGHLDLAWLREDWIGSSLSAALLEVLLHDWGESPELLALIAEKFDAPPAKEALLARAVRLAEVRDIRSAALQTYLARERLWALGQMGLGDRMLELWELLPETVRAEVARRDGDRPRAFGEPLRGTGGDLTLLLAFAYVAKGDPLSAERLLPPERHGVEEAECLDSSEAREGDRCEARRTERIAWDWLRRWLAGETFDAFDVVASMISAHRVNHYARRIVSSISWTQGASILAQDSGYPSVADYFERAGAAKVDWWLDSALPNVARLLPPEVSDEIELLNESLLTRWGASGEFDWLASPRSALVDSDGDGLSDAVERAWLLDPETDDSDQDGVPDGIDPMARTRRSRWCDERDALVRRMHEKSRFDVIVADPELVDCLEPASALAYLSHDEARERKANLTGRAVLRVDLVLVDPEATRALTVGPGMADHLVRTQDGTGWKQEALWITTDCGITPRPEVPLPTL